MNFLSFFSRSKCFSQLNAGQNISQERSAHESMICLLLNEKHKPSFSRRAAFIPIGFVSISILNKNHKEEMTQKSKVL